MMNFDSWRALRSTRALLVSGALCTLASMLGCAADDAPGASEEATLAGETTPAEGPVFRPPVSSDGLASELDTPVAELASAPGTFRNPLNTKEGSDPFMVYHEGYYYLTATTWSSELFIRKSRTIEGLKTATPVRVWKGDASSRCCNFWAPELYLLDGPSGKRWYLYYTAGPAGTNTDNQRNFVLESKGTDPLGPYTFKARIYDARNDSWAIDPSVVKLGDRLYFLFSAWEGQDQGVYIAAMSNPWTISGTRSRISRPSYSWETQLARVNEGPVALQRNGKTFITYSASACWGPDYKLGMLTYNGGNPLNARSWIKSPQPVFQRSNGNRAYGPGHNGFFKSPDGKEDWIVYHANASDKGVCDTKRTTRVQKINWRSDGTPSFGAPAATGVDLPVPSGEKP